MRKSEKQTEENSEEPGEFGMIDVCEGKLLHLSDFVETW